MTIKSTHSLKPFAVWLLLVAAPLAAQSAQVIQLADNSDAQKRFMSLDSERNGTAHALPVASKNSGLRSDNAALKQGFMLLDRGRSVPIPLQHTLAVPAKKSSDDVASQPQVSRGTTISGAAPAPITPDSEDISDNGAADPVLSLFNGGKSAPIASFRDALRGKGAVTPMAVGHYAWPIPASAQQKLSSGYGPRANPFGGKSEFHGGIDISAPIGTSVLATADGTITKAGQDSHYGKFISIAHPDGSVSQYGHLSMQSVHEGQQVRRGQIIGAVGATGHATGSHLDFRISQNGTRIDPMTVLSAPGATTVAMATTSARPTMRPSTVKSMMITVR